MQHLEVSFPESSATRRIAMVKGGAKAMRAAAEALEALDRGETPKAELPAGVVIDPTKKQIANECRPLGVKPPPATIPKNGWRTPIFAMATPSPQRKQFTDPAKEAAVVGALAGDGLFNQIPAAKLIPAAAFVDEFHRILYGAARVVLARGSAVCLESINDELAASGQHKRIARVMDPSGKLSADIWKQWPERADLSLANCFNATPIAYCLEELQRLHQKRQAAFIGEKLHSGELEIAQAQKELDALANGANGSFNFASADERRFQAEKLHDKPEATLLLDGKSICTNGNLSVIYAKPKAGKSAVVSAIIGAAMSDDPLNDYLGFSTRENTAGHALIHVDTEQSRYDHEQIVLRALRRGDCEQPPPWLRSYCITDFSFTERRTFLAAEIERAKRQCQGVFAVIVDGVGDFIPNVNDTVESNEFALELHALAIRYDTIMLLVLHENPNEETQKTRGHLGSQLERKAESNIRITKDAEGIMAIYTERSRHAHIPKTRAHLFKWDEAKATHVSYEKERTVKDESDLVEALFNCELAREQAGGLQWAELLDRFIELKLYKNRNGVRRRFQKLLADGWLRKQGDYYWPARP